MNRRDLRRAAAAVVAVLLVTGCAGGGEDPGTDTPAPETTSAPVEPVEAEEPAPEEPVEEEEETPGPSLFSTPFAEYTVPELFSVELPGEPTLESDEVATVTGPVAFDMYSVTEADGAVMVGYNVFTDLPGDAVAQDLLTASIAGAADSLGGEVVAEAEVDGAEHPARDGEITVAFGEQEILLHLRVILVEGSELFQLQSLGMSSQRAAIEADFQRLTSTFTPLS